MVFMNAPCSRFSERLVAIAEGRVDGDAERHVASCANCASTLSEYRKIVSIARESAFSVPASMVVAAKALFTGLPVRPQVRLVSSSVRAGARALPADLQVAIEAAGNPVRLMYTRKESGWEVLGTLPGPDWRAEKEKGLVKIGPDGRFSFAVPKVSATGFRLASSEQTVDVPSLEDLLFDGNDRPS